MKNSTFSLRLLIRFFSSLFAFLSLFYKDDEENESAFYH